MGSLPRSFEFRMSLTDDSQQLTRLVGRLLVIRYVPTRLLIYCRRFPGERFGKLFCQGLR